MATIDSDLDFSVDPFKHYQEIKDYLDFQFNRLSKKYKMKPIEIDQRLCKNPKYKTDYCKAKQIYSRQIKPENCGDIYESWLFSDMKQQSYIDFVKQVEHCKSLFESVFSKID